MDALTKQTDGTVSSFSIPIWVMIRNILKLILVTLCDSDSVWKLLKCLEMLGNCNYYLRDVKSPYCCINLLFSLCSVLSFCRSWLSLLCASENMPHVSLFLCRLDPGHTPNHNGHHHHRRPPVDGRMSPPLEHAPPVPTEVRTHNDMYENQRFHQERDTRSDRCVPHPHPAFSY